MHDLYVTSNVCTLQKELAMSRGWSTIFPFIARWEMENFMNCQPQAQSGVRGPLVNGDRVRLCKDGQKCVVAGCNFSHDPIQKPCKFGNECPRNEKCLFDHTSVINISKNEGGRA